MHGKEKLKLLVLFFIMAVSGTLSYYSLNNGHDWGDDFALYINQTQSIVNGTEIKCLQENIFAMDESTGPSGPYLYPWGFPLILAPVFVLLGFNLFAFKITGIVFFILSLLLVFFLFKKRSSSNALIIAALIGFNPFLIAFNDNILSDFPFLFFCLLSLLLILKVIVIPEKSFKKPIWYVILGFAIFYSFNLRPNGIVLLLVLIISQVIEYYQNKKTPSFQFSLKPLIPSAVFLVFYLINKLFFPHSKESHLEYLKKINLDQILLNIEYYFTEIPKVFFGYFDLFNLSLILLPFALIGGAKTLKQEYPFHLFFAGTLSIFLIWPDTEGLRYVFPLIPVFLYFTFTGLLLVNQKIKIFFKYGFLPKLVGLLLMVFFLQKSILNLNEKGFSTNQVIEGPFNSESLEAFKYLNENSSKEDIIIFFKPRALNLILKRRSALIFEFERIQSVNASYLVIHKLMAGYNQINPEDERLSSTEWLKPVFENNHYLIYRIN